MGGRGVGARSGIRAGRSYHSVASPDAARISISAPNWWLQASAGATGLDRVDSRNPGEARGRRLRRRSPPHRDPDAGMILHLPIPFPEPARLLEDPGTSHQSSWKRRPMCGVHVAVAASRTGPDAPLDGRFLGLSPLADAGNLTLIFAPHDRLVGDVRRRGTRIGNVTSRSGLIGSPSASATGRRPAPACGLRSRPGL